MGRCQDSAWWGSHGLELLPAVPAMGAELVDAVDVFEVKPFVS
jgi:hypothetical protein